MALGEGLGRLFNAVPVAAGTLISLKDAAGVTFLVTAASATETFTVSSAASWNGTTTPLTAISRYYTSTSQSGAAQWADSGDIPPVSSIQVAAGSAAMFYVGADDLPAGAEYASVAVTGSGTGTVTAIVHDLLVQRQPKNLRALSGASS